MGVVLMGKGAVCFQLSCKEFRFDCKKKTRSVINVSSYVSASAPPPSSDTLKNYIVNHWLISYCIVHISGYFENCLELPKAEFICTARQYQ